MANPVPIKKQITTIDKTLYIMINGLITGQSTVGYHSYQTIWDPKRGDVHTRALILGNTAAVHTCAFILGNVATVCTCNNQALCTQLRLCQHASVLS